MKRSVVLAAIPLAGLGLVGLTGCGSAAPHATAAAAAAKPAANPVVQMDVLTGKLSKTYGIIGPDGRGHDTFAPSEFTAEVGQTYTIRVYNYDEGAHTFTIDALGINKTINPHVSDDQPSVTTFTVTFTKTGVFRFYCKLPCDAGQGGWAMKADRNGKGNSQDGYMAGYVNVISA